MVIRIFFASIKQSLNTYCNILILLFNMRWICKIYSNYIFLNPPFSSVCPRPFPFLVSQCLPKNFQSWQSAMQMRLAMDSAIKVAPNAQRAELVWKLINAHTPRGLKFLPSTKWSGDLEPLFPSGPCCIHINNCDLSLGVCRQQIMVKLVVGSTELRQKYCFRFLFS